MKEIVTEEVTKAKRPKLKVIGLTMDVKTRRFRQVLAPIDAVAEVMPNTGRIVGVTVDPETGQFKRLTRKDLSKLEREAVERRAEEEVKKDAEEESCPKLIHSFQVPEKLRPELRLKKPNTHEPWRRKLEGNKRRGRG